MNAIFEPSLVPRSSRMRNMEGWTMTAKECPESGTRRSLKGTLALWAGRIALIAIAASSVP